MQNKKVIYIAGLGHSGSTILDMSLGCGKNVIGLGEIMAYVRRKDKMYDLKSTCSCGKKGFECDFWKDTLAIVNQANNETKAYFKIVEYFFEKYGSDKVLVDSSKNSYSYLQKLNKDYDLKVIFLTRDFRSWAFSMSTRKKTPVFYAILRWWAEIKKLELMLKKMNIEYLNVGYEEFALYPEFVLKKIAQYCKIDFQETMLNPSLTNSHIIAGNIVRADKEANNSIRYDARWMTSFKMSFWGGIFSFMNRFNKKRVYSNILNKNLKSDSLKFFEKDRRKSNIEKFN